MVGIIFFLLMGIAFFTYPYVSNYLNEKNQSYAIQEYDKAIGQKQDEDIKDQLERAKKYNEGLQGTVIRDPFIEGSGMVMQRDYEELLNVDGIMGHIEIPKIHISLPICHGTSEKVLQKGIGHLEGSSLPVGGEGNHGVLTGHSGLSTARYFTDLSEMEIGDIFYLKILDQGLAYKIDKIKVVLPEEIGDIKAVDGKDLITLVTCTPYGINSHRLLVRGIRTPYEEEVETLQTEEMGKGLTERERMLIITGVSSIIGIVIFLAQFRLWRKWKEYKDYD